MSESSHVVLALCPPPPITPDLLLLPYGADGLDLLGLLLAGQGKQGSTEVQKSDFRIRQV